MPGRIISTRNASHYQWGGALGTSADAWFLLQHAEIHVIEELLPAGLAETRHSHRRARQFFFVLEGELAMEVDGDFHAVGAGEGIEIAPGEAHQAANRGSGPLRILVISQPPSHGDRVEFG